MMNTRNVFAIARKDWIEVRQNKFTWVPMLIMPILFDVVFPLLIILLMTNIQMAPQSLTGDADLETFFRAMPPSISQFLDFSRPVELAIIVILGYMLAPMFLMLPLMYSTTIAAESFAGERERKTIEALLYTPATDVELFLGKVVASAIPSILITWIGFGVYTLILNLAPYSVFQRFWFPLPTWWPLIFWVSPALVMFGICFTVLISEKVPTFLGAYQTASSTVLLVVILFAGQMTGILYLSVGVGLLLGLLLWIIAAVLAFLAVRTFNREKLLTS
jgi:ABC-2 type transport system permease protein